MKSVPALLMFCIDWCLLKELQIPLVELGYGLYHIKRKRCMKYLKEIHIVIERCCNIFNKIKGKNVRARNWQNACYICAVRTKKT